jgi:hypothetical protein
MAAPVNNNLDISLQYLSYSERLKSSLITTATQQANSWDSKRPCWELSRKAQALAKEMFGKFCEDVRTRFPQPDYQEWLEMSIRVEKLRFQPDLEYQIKACFPETL